MGRRSLVIDDSTLLIADDDTPPPELGWWAVLRTRVIDEITEAPPLAPVQLTTDTPACRPRNAADGVCGLVARPRDAATALTRPGQLRATLRVDGFLPQVLDAAIDAARRQLPAGATAGDPQLVVAPPDTVDRPQFHPGRGVMIERAAPGLADQFTQQADPVVAPALNEVPLVDPVAATQAVGAHLAGVPVVLPDQRLHRAEPSQVRGRALRQLAPGSAPIAAPGALIGIRGVWWTLAEVAANSVPPHPPRFVTFDAPLAFPHPAGVAVERVALTSDGVARRCRERAFATNGAMALHPWTGLNPLGGDVLRIESVNSAICELVVTAGFDASLHQDATASIQLRTPLAFAHANTAPIDHVAVVATGLGTLEREAVAGDRVLFPTTLAAVPTDDAWRVDAGTAAELRFVRCMPTWDGVAFTHLATPDVDGRFELPPVARLAQLQYFVQHPGFPAQLPIDFAPLPGSDNALQVLFTP